MFYRDWNIEKNSRTYSDHIDERSIHNIQGNGESSHSG